VREDPGSGRPIQCVTKYEPRQTSWLVFIIYPPILTEVANFTTRTKRQCETTTTPETPMTPETTTTPLPSPLCPNASQRWTFQRFQCCFHCFHPPLWRFNTSATTTTSLASKCEPEVDLSMISTPLPPLPPPSHPNASRRWIFLAF
jgi:hypothetical protein